ncbi:major facilitator superfamily domain-containing protein [Aspergillus stella-maris]|uniref:major facilitator superfamily domain-containing protein n=1 Tax=Aspergillus stella-maris TaxID=1810926 RepID=UPI003CCD0AF4
MASHNAWDCHIHCFEPGRHPFRPGRAYTPPPASIENGYNSFFDTLVCCQKRYDNVVIRGTIAIQTPWEEPTPSTCDALHELGVRSIRIHVQTLGWKLSAQLLLRTWAALMNFLLSDRGLSHLHLIADHNGFATPNDIGGPDLDAFVELLRSKRVSVKISALYRRSPNDIDQMQPIIQTFANAAPGGLIWGSDWPHVDSTAGGSGRPPLRGPADVAEELELLHTWLSYGQWRRLNTAKQDTPKMDPVKDWKEDSPSGNESSGIMAVYHSYDEDYIRIVEGQLRRKIDIRILPIVVLIYLFNYLDRNSITQARLYGLQEDTGVKGAEYQTAISIFSAGYIVMQLPATILMTKLRPSFGCTSAVSSTAGLLVVRFVLGFVEAPFFPGAVYFLSYWYTKRELGVRMALLISGIVLSNAFAGLISAAWRWLFIIEGLATIVLGVIAMIVLPDFPGTTKWLTEPERIVAQARLAIDAGSVDLLDEEKVPITKGIGRAVRDYRIGFDNNTIVLLLTSPPYVVAFVWSLRSPFAGVSQVTAIIGTILMVATPQHLPWPRYAFTFLVCCGTFGVYSTTYAWLSSTITQPLVKRAAAIGLANTCANIASLYGNYFWLDKYGPSFHASWGCILAFQCLGLTCIMTLRYVLRRANKKFERLRAEVDVHDVRGLNDDEKRGVLNGFRYII